MFIFAPIKKESTYEGTRQQGSAIFKREKIQLIEKMSTFDKFVII